LFLHVLYRFNYLCKKNILWKNKCYKL